SIYLRWYVNSLFITLIVTVLCLFFSSMVGYALAVYQFRGRNVVFVAVLFILMVPFEILMLSLFRLMTAFNLIDTYAAVVLPSVIAPIAVFQRYFISGL